jgi:hypothetical protein
MLGNRCLIPVGFSMPLTVKSKEKRDGCKYSVPSMREEHARNPLNRCCIIADTVDPCIDRAHLARIFLSVRCMVGTKTLSSVECHHGGMENP